MQPGQEGPSRSSRDADLVELDLQLAALLLGTAVSLLSLLLDLDDKILAHGLHALGLDPFPPTPEIPETLLQQPVVLVAEGSWNLRGIGSLHQAHRHVPSGLAALRRPGHDFHPVASGLQATEASP